MHQRIKHLAAAIAALIGACLLTSMAGAISLDELSWQTISSDLGVTIRFTARFLNPNELPSDPVTGKLSSQSFGAFGGNAGSICDFEIPSLPGGDTYNVVCDIPLDQLPPSARRIIPYEGDSPFGGQAPGASATCPVDDFWAGGVEAAWTGDGDGREVVDRGTLFVCPEFGNSYIQLTVDCPEGASWQFFVKCFGFEVGLVDDKFQPAPNPLPPGTFTGWIAVDGNPKLPPGEPCDFNLEFNCGSKTGRIFMSTVTCDCSRPTSLEPSTWGAIKQRLSR